jgi:hypothetical protein
VSSIVVIAEDCGAHREEAIDVGVYRHSNEVKSRAELYADNKVFRKALVEGRKLFD